MSSKYSSLVKSLGANAQRYLKPIITVSYFDNSVGAVVKAYPHEVLQTALNTQGAKALLFPDFEVRLY